MPCTRTGGLYDIDPVVAPVEKQPAILPPPTVCRRTGRPVTFPHRPNHRDRHRLDISRGPCRESPDRHRGGEHPRIRLLHCNRTFPSRFLFPANALPPIRKQRIPKTRRQKGYIGKTTCPAPAGRFSFFVRIRRHPTHAVEKQNKNLFYRTIRIKIRNFILG